MLVRRRGRGCRRGRGDRPFALSRADSHVEAVHFHPSRSGLRGWRGVCIAVAAAVGHSLARLTHTNISDHQCHWHQGFIGGVRRVNRRNLFSNRSRSVKFDSSAARFFPLPQTSLLLPPPPSFITTAISTNFTLQSNCIESGIFYEWKGGEVQQSQVRVAACAGLLAPPSCAAAI